jgi:hypothetical protein
MIGDSFETSRLDRFPGLAGSVYSAWKTKVRRSYYPALAVRVDNPAQAEVRMRIGRTYLSLCRSLHWFSYASGILGLMNAHLLPDVYNLQLLFALAPPLLMGSVRVLHRAGFEVGKPQLGMTGISDAAYIDNLKRMLGVLIGGKFSPSKFMLRSAIDVFLAVLLFFGPAYVTLRWFAGDALPVETDIYGILWRFAVGILMTLIFVSLRTSNRYAADVMEDEIDALQAAMMDTPVSA